VDRPYVPPLMNRQDVRLLVQLIRELGAYEREPESAAATEEDLLRDGFDTSAPRFQSLIAEFDREPAGLALFFTNYSSWHGRPGIHVEDLFVRSHLRGRGIGKPLLRLWRAKQ
jgi:GNAT superfamily N-acetyltransferase